MTNKTKGIRRIALGSGLLLLSLVGLAGILLSFTVLGLGLLHAGLSFPGVLLIAAFGVDQIRRGRNILKETKSGSVPPISAPTEHASLLNSTPSTFSSPGPSLISSNFNKKPTTGFWSCFFSCGRREKTKVVSVANSPRRSMN